MEKMIAVRKMNPAPGLELSETEVPEPGKGKLLVEVTATSMCGTDVHIYNWEPPFGPGRLNPPITIGHEVVGKVIGIGEGVEGFADGDSVSAESHIYDNTCNTCKLGNVHICENIKFYGVDTNGFWAKYALIDISTAWKNPPSLPPEIATLQESMGNSVYTVEESNVKDKDVVIFGTGPTGLFSIAIAKAMGARKVMVVYGSDMHGKISKQMGADNLINRHEKDPVKEVLELTEGKGADVVLEMSGAEQAINNALDAVRPVGMVTVLGLPPKPLTIDISKKIVLKDLTFRGIYGRRIWDTWKTTSRLLSEGLDITPIITHRLKLDEFEKGIEAMKSGQSGKVVFFPK